jgi:hypothetical protein|tara:strand:+ start:761 stop:1003 length:243 start_codon:yes stop_codon:yes gene_type:complete
MEKLTRDDFIRQYTEYTVNKMDEVTLKQIAQINLFANINPESTYADWEDAVAQMESKRTVEDLLELIKPFMTLRERPNAG